MASETVCGDFSLSLLMSLREVSGQGCEGLGR